MKTFINILTFISLIIVINSCKSEVISNIDKTSDSFVISGGIEDWVNLDRMEIILGTYVNDEFYDFKSAPIKSNGTFYFIFPTLNEQNLVPIVDLENVSGDSSILINNPTTKGILASFYISNKEHNSQEILNHRLDISGDSVRVYKIDFVFCNDIVDVTGEITVDNITMIYNLHYNKGWNKRVIVKNEITSVEPSGYKWLAGH